MRIIKCKLDSSTEVSKLDLAMNSNRMSSEISLELEGAATVMAFELWFNVALIAKMNVQAAFLLVTSWTCGALPAILIIQVCI